MGEEDTKAGLDELLPERRDHEDKLWYLLGTGATALIIGILDMINYFVPRDGLLIFGLTICVGGFIWLVIRDD